ncbi:hypothetical protein [Paenibacillus cremeus]|uniref:hypothetical protein n=1 Tax=Paenibacillus cremeus TaxID=2163881 RepID=UPI001C93FD96|nr:hypothetical protein [Paenibacillus cremeus]
MARRLSETVLAVISVAVSIAAAYLGWVLIEKPFMSIGKNVTARLTRFHQQLKQKQLHT